MLGVVYETQISPNPRVDSINETNYEYNNLFSIFSERGKGEKKNDENSAASLKNHVNENIFILFMLEYQIKFSAAFFFAFSGL